MRSILLILLVLAAATVTFSQSRRSARPQVQRVTVSLSGYTYTPGEFRLRKGVPARVTFIRKTEGGCGDVITIPDYGIRRDLPLGQPVTVAFTPTRAGTFTFACGMGMLRGKIVVG